MDTQTMEGRRTRGGPCKRSTSSVYPEDGGMSSRLTYTVPEVAARLGVPVKTVYWWCEQGILPHLKASRRVLVPVAALEQWIARQTQPGAHPAPMPPPVRPFPAPRSRRRRVLS